MHKPTPVTPATPPAALVHVAGEAVDHAALAAHLVGRPVARVGVAGAVEHGAGPAALRGHVLARVLVVVHVDGAAGAVGPAPRERAGEVGAGEVGGCDGAGGAVGEVVVQVEVVEVGGWCGEVAAVFDGCCAGLWS